MDKTILSAAHAGKDTKLDDARLKVNSAIAQRAISAHNIVLTWYRPKARMPTDVADVRARRISKRFQTTIGCCRLVVFFVGSALGTEG